VPGCGTGSCERVLSHNGPVVSASFGPAGQVLTASSDRTARLWSYDGDALQKFSGHVHSACFSPPKGDQVLSASHAGAARLLNLNGECLSLKVFKEHSAHAYQANFSSDGQKVVTVSADDISCIFDVASGELQVTPARCIKLCFRLMTPRCSLQRPTGLSDVKSGTFLKYFAEHGFDGTQVITAGDDRAVRIFNAASGVCLRCFQGHGEHVYVHKFSPNSRQVLTGSEDYTAPILRFVFDGFSVVLVN